MSIRLLPYGERAALLEVGSIDEVIGTYDAVQQLALAGLEDVVPSAVTVLVSFVDAAAFRRALPVLEAIEPSSAGHEPGELVTIPVVYDGEDLADVAEMTGLSVDAAIEAHSGAEYIVAFNGFAPGFSYLIGLDERLRVPRRLTPRTSVPAGSVAMTGQFTAVYPRVSPGGWQLLGRTDTAMWSSERDQPSLLHPGSRVRFEPA